jgi:hypothetical protein
MSLVRQVEMTLPGDFRRVFGVTFLLVRSTTGG